MRQLAWNPLWVQSYESILSVAIKVAYVNTASVTDIASMVVGATPTSRKPLWLPESDIASAACHLLDIDDADLKNHFGFVGMAVLDERANFRMALRWCPKCLEEHFHSALFQDVRRSHCPWHDVLLRDSCPRCNGAVDPIKLDGWRCSNCCMSLATPPKDWLARFKVRLTRPAPNERWLATYSYNAVVDPALKLITYKYNDHAEFGINEWAQQYESEEVWIQSLVFEESCAIADSLLADHSKCLNVELLAANLDLAPTRFDCPAAAAIVHAIAWLGTRAQELGGWPERVRNRSCDFAVLLDTLHQGQRWIAPFVVRETVRRWTFDSLIAFTNAAKAGAYALEWRPSRSSVCSAVAGPDTAVLPNLISATELESAVVNAASFCRCHTGASELQIWKSYRA